MCESSTRHTIVSEGFHMIVSPFGVAMDFVEDVGISQEGAEAGFSA